MDCRYWPYAYDPVPASAGARCSSNDGRTHRLEADTARFLSVHRHGAEIAAVWLVGGNEGAANGITGGMPHFWFQVYQQSSP